MSMSQACGIADSLGLAARHGNAGMRLSLTCLPNGPGRLTRKQRKTSITEELLADKALAQQRKRRFGRLQAERQQWSSRRRRKTDNDRLKKHRKAPKH